MSEDANELQQCKTDRNYALTHANKTCHFFSYTPNHIIHNHRGASASVLLNTALGAGESAGGTIGPLTPLSPEAGPISPGAFPYSPLKYLWKFSGSSNGRGPNS